MTSIRHSMFGPAFHVDVRPDGELARLAPVGELDLATAQELEAQLGSVCAAGFARIVLDLSQVTFMDSSGVHLVLRHIELANAGGYEIELLPGPDQVQRVFEISGVLAELPFGAGALPLEEPPLPAEARAPREPAPRAPASRARGPRARERAARAPAEAIRVASLTSGVSASALSDSASPGADGGTGAADAYDPVAGGSPWRQKR